MTGKYVDIDDAGAAIDEIQRISGWLGYADPDELTKHEEQRLIELAKHLSAWFIDYAERVGL